MAALERELAPLRKLGNRRFSLLVTGEGVMNAGRNLREALAHRPPRVVLGIGFAGALTDSLEAGDLVLITHVEGLTEAKPAATLVKAAESMSVDRLKCGVAVTVDEIVSTSAEKLALAHELGLTEPAVVDMESSAVARACAEQRVPFLIVRAITDMLSEDLPIDFNRCRSTNGRISTSKVLRAAAARPAAIKGLLQLGRQSKICAGRLARFVERFAEIVEG